MPALPCRLGLGESDDGGLEEFVELRFRRASSSATRLLSAATSPMSRAMRFLMPMEPTLRQRTHLKVTSTRPTAPVAPALGLLLDWVYHLTTRTWACYACPVVGSCLFH